MTDRNGHKSFNDAIQARKNVRRVAAEEMVTDWALILFVIMVAFLVTVVAPTLDMWVRS